MLDQSGWAIQDLKNAYLQAKSGVAIRNFSLKPGHGLADYLLYVEGKAAGVIEAKKVGSTLCGVEIQSGKYTNGLPDSLPAWYRPLPFGYESTGVETRSAIVWILNIDPGMSFLFINRIPWLSGCGK
jgi:type I restriction enzyme, R subunit